MNKEKGAGEGEGHGDMGAEAWLDLRGLVKSLGQDPGMVLSRGDAGLTP